MLVGYYITTLRDSRQRYARGPFDSLAAAEASIPETRALAQRLDPWSDFDAWGVTKYTAKVLPTGPMNHFWTVDGY